MSDSLTHLLRVSIDFTNVTLVNEDTKMETMKRMGKIKETKEEDEDEDKFICDKSYLVIELFLW